MAALSKLVNLKDRICNVWNRIARNLLLLSAFLGLEGFNRILTKSIRDAQSSLIHFVSSFDGSVVVQSVHSLVALLLHCPLAENIGEQIIENEVGGVGEGFITMFLRLIVDGLLEGVNNLLRPDELAEELAPAVDGDAPAEELVQSYVGQFLTFGLSFIGAGLKNS